MMLEYFVDIYIKPYEIGIYPTIEKQNTFMRIVKRYSGTQKSKITMKGMIGRVIFDDIAEEYIPYVLAGELLHIGKNTSFGFGRYTLQ